MPHQRGPQLACFFKTPLGCDEQDFAKQMDLLARYAAAVREETGAVRRSGT